METWSGATSIDSPFPENRCPACYAESHSRILHSTKIFPKEMDQHVLDFAEREGKENLKFQIECGDDLQKQSNTTLSFLITGGGAALAFSFKEFQANPDTNPLFWVLGAVSCYFFLLACILVRKCLWVGLVMPPTNEPKNLMVEGFGVDQIREAELSNIQHRIEFNANRNESVGNSLNRVRVAIFASPIFCILVYGITNLAICVVSYLEAGSD